MIRLVPFHPERLWKRYLLALGLLLVLVTGGFALYRMELSSAESDGALVELAARQIVLAQRMALSPQPFPADLDAYATAHDRLVAALHGDPLTDLFRPGMAGGLDAASRVFLSDMRARAAAPPSQAAMPLPSGLLQRLELAAHLFAREAESHIVHLKLLQTAGFALSLLVLGAEALLVYLPTHLSISQSIAREAERRHHLLKSNEALRRVTERLEHSTLHDALTGLPGRRKFLAELERRLSAARIGGVCVMMVDLDRFKEINDAEGPREGDAHLKRVARILEGVLRQQDFVARVGGDAFALVLDFAPRYAPDLARSMAQAVLEAIRTPVATSGLHRAASLGYVISSPASRTAEALMADADLALDNAKAGGRGIALRFDPAMRAGLEWRRGLRMELERAVERDEFVPYFQPKCRLADGEIEGFEVLVRWRHPERGILPPSEFLEAAEEAGLLDLIDTRMLHLGLDVLKDLHGLGEKVTLAFNASANSLRQADWVDDLGMALAMRGLQRSDIVIEVLENILIQDAEDQAVRSIRALTGLGTRVDIDDFGTGYASMSMLALLDIGGLKIDRSLVEGLEDPRDRQVVEAVAGLSHGLGLKVTAEGAETPAQFAILRELGIETVQGFGIGHPMPAKALPDWLADWRQTERGRAVSTCRRAAG